MNVACFISFLMPPYQLEHTNFGSFTFHYPIVILSDFPFSRKGFMFTTFVCESSKLLPHLLQRFKNSGGLVQKQRVTNLLELRDSYDVVVNCSGIFRSPGVGQRWASTANTWSYYPGTKSASFIQKLGIDSKRYVGIFFCYIGKSTRNDARNFG